ncbi:MltR family transcriptional regulator [Photobacterium swingsii]|uniref:MltR family transcriptional regulator n=1 Tax=Photobacterium swingsii TaxID=680026 RepID=UPI003D10C5C0
MAHSDLESDILERLNNSPTARGFFMASVEVFDESVDRLIQRVFRKDDFAVKSVVEPLLDTSGPLGQLPVRLKLLFGLGVVSHDIYHDIEQFIQLRDFLNTQGSEYEFTDPVILSSIKELKVIQKMGVVQLEIAPLTDDVDLQFYQMQMARQQQVIKSSLALSIATLCQELDKDSPF